MAFNITEIQSAINAKDGLARPNMFFVRITPPRSLLVPGYTRDASFFCDAAQLPGINFSAQTVKSVGYGTSEQRPVDAGFSPINTTFIVDAKGRGIRFFQQWLALINNWTRETTGVMRGTRLSYGEWNYPVTYEGTVEIHSLNPVGPNGKDIVVYQLSRAFPIQVGDISVAWELNDAIMRLPVVFAYNTWDTANINIAAIEEGFAQQNLPPESDQGALDLQLSTLPRQQITRDYSLGITVLQSGTVTPSIASQFANME